MPVESGRCLSGLYIREILRYFIFTSRSVALPMRLRIPRESLLVFHTSSTLYVLCEGLGYAIVGGVVDGVSLALVGGVGDCGEG